MTLLDARALARDFDYGSLPPEVRAQGEVHLALDGTLTPAQYQQIERIKRSTFFLVRNNGATTGERWACKHHKVAGGPALSGHVHFAPVIHPFFTVACVPAPWTGLDEGLIAYAQVSHDPEVARRLAPFIPELADSQPGLARTLRPPRGTDFYAFVVGVVEPITAAYARELRERIAQRTRTPVRRGFRV